MRRGGGGGRKRGGTKRKADNIEEVGEGANFRFQTLDGRLIPATELFSVFSQQLLLMIMRYFDHTRVRLLERTSKLARGWVQRWNVWRQLVARDFPYAFKEHYDNMRPETAFMSERASSSLDSVSENPGRPETLWKRYYEFLSKRFDARFVFTDAQHFAHGGRPIAGKETFQVKYVMSIWSEQHPLHPEMEPQYKQFYRANPSEGVDVLGYIVTTYLPFEEPPFPSEPKDLPAYIPRMQEYRRRWDMENAEIMRTSNMLKILVSRDLDRVWTKREPYDETKLGQNLHGEKDKTSFISADGFDAFKFGDDLMYVAWLPLTQYMKRKLVSSCMVCGSTDDIQQCLGCEQVAYCGKQCQLEDWQSGHRKMCSFYK